LRGVVHVGGVGVIDDFNGVVAVVEDVFGRRVSEGAGVGD
jgi:hypothetical protein